MDAKKQGSSSFSSRSSFSLANELFGSMDSSSSSSSSSSASSGIFHSIFPPPSKAHGKDLFRSEATEKKHVYSGKQDSVDKEGKNQGPPKMDSGSFYQQERMQPCTLSSSIYYGGQDIYTNPQTTQSNSGYSSPPQYNKDGGEDDGRASRGNWWQGSLYY